MIHTILVTDDNILDNAVLKNYLSKQRYNIISAINGNEALEMVEGRNIDLIILDLVMPVLDGYGFLNHFSKTSLYKQIPIIVSSSLDNTKDIEEVLKYDIYDYIIKPLNELDRTIFLNKIRKAIHYRQNLLKLNKAEEIINKLSVNTAL